MLSIRGTGTEHDITDYLNKWDQIEDFKGDGKVNSEYDTGQSQYFLVQVNKPGSENVINNLTYSHSDWDTKRHDHDHGMVREGDILLFYFARGSIQYKKQLKKIYRVNTVSDHNRTFTLTEERELNGLALEDIRNAIKGNKLRREVFGKVSQQGFNIKMMEKSDYDSVISLDEEKKQRENVTDPNLWVVKTGENGQGGQIAKRHWLSLNKKEIEEIVDNVLKAEGRKLEIDKKVVKRVISHLIVAKHVILVGPPGTGKTDLGRRLLRELGMRIIGKEKPVEAVASYEWGRYEVIGGNSIISNSKENLFHPGCVTDAILQGRLLLIDEFNRADMNKAFGEMFMALDHGNIELRKDETIQVRDSYRKAIQIPTDFRMICTMNDYDKSLLNELSYGLLRRFAYVEINVPSKKRVGEQSRHRACKA